jgi:5-formyltetrahydrofolate cyclo-ligase
MPDDARQDKSRRAAELLFTTPEYHKTEVLMIYLSLPHEVDTTDIVLQAWKDHKRVLAPRVGWESRQMIPVEINDLDNAEITNVDYGLREPTRGVPFPTELIDLVIVPGLGFDPQGNRLGRGRGFYDRFLSNPEFKGVSCAFAFEDQVVEAIPANELDVRVHMLVTDQSIRRFKSPS